MCRFVKLKGVGEGKTSTGSDDDEWEITPTQELDEGVFEPIDNYPVHAACYNILQQLYLADTGHGELEANLLGEILTLQDVHLGGQFRKPDWSGNWGEEAWFGAGWMDDEGVGADFDHEDLDETYRHLSWLDFLARDPEDMTELEPLFRHPPTTNLDPTGPVRFTTWTKAASERQQRLRLPPELWVQIMCLLSARCVRSLRLAVRAVAAIPLSQQWWLSRFDFPHELSHLPLPSQIIQDMDSSTSVDWPRFAARLLHPTSSPFPCWSNRKRILHVNRLLVRRLTRFDRIWHVTVVEDDVTPAQDDMARTKWYCVPHKHSDLMCRATFTDRVTVSSLRSVAVSFVKAYGTPVMSGMTFSNGQDVIELGHCEPETAEKIELDAGSELIGLIIALDRIGVRGVKVLVRNCDEATVTRDATAGIFTRWEDVAQGTLIPSTPSQLRGFEANLGTDNVIVSIAVLTAGCSSSTPLPPSIPWDPAPPPTDTRVSLEVGSAPAEANIFSRSKRVLFADDISTGSKGEVVVGADVVQWDDSQGIGISLLTNWGRRAFFVQIRDRVGLRVTQLMVPKGMFLRGFFGRFDESYWWHSEHAYRTFGLLYSDAGMVEASPPPSDLEQAQQYDDHGNLWISDEIPPASYIPGEVIGSQAENGFIDWIDLSKPVKELRVCTGNLSSDSTSAPHDLIGLAVRRNGESTPHLVGNDQGCGSTFEGNMVQDGLRILVISDRGYLNLPSPSAIQLFSHATSIGQICKSEAAKDLDSFKEPNLSHDVTKAWSVDRKWQVLESTSTLRLVGLIWSYNAGFHKKAIQPLYEIQESSELAAMSRRLYPSLREVLSMPDDIEVRPIPAGISKGLSFSTTIGGGSTPRSQLACIKMYLNSFLQGVELLYRDGRVCSAGNLVGATQTIHLEEDERICSIHIHDRLTDATEEKGVGEILCVHGLSFGLVKNYGLQQIQRKISFPGGHATFGPFVDHQRGLRSRKADSRDLNKLQARTVDVRLQPGTTFAGLYLESMPNYVRRAGVLVSHQSGLPRLIGVSSPDSESAVPHLPLRHELDAVSPHHTWYGDAPPPTMKVVPSPINGTGDGKYRMWCPIPRGLTKITIYRAQRERIIGIEFHSHSARGSLIGWRSYRHEGTIIVGCDDANCQRWFGVRIQKTLHGLDVVAPGPRDLPHVMTGAEWDLVRPWDVGHGVGDIEQLSPEQDRDSLALYRVNAPEDDIAQLVVNPQGQAGVVVGVWAAVDTGIEELGLIESREPR
ncbi:MAG: hypothetical protein M1817_004822 [Caeruleum heppii]|nr:MAG: hypothetical protein M1817_004822 [Caeruleum heppii]